MKTPCQHQWLAAIIVSITVASLASSRAGAQVVFGPAAGYPVEAFPTSVAAAHLNNDAYLDLVTTNQDSDTASVLINNGDGTFVAGVNYPVGANSLRGRCRRS